MSQQSATPLLRLSDVSKSFAGTDALQDISLEVHAGQVLCLLGDNGAGKSTLIKILSGFHAPTTGTVEADGAPVVLKSPRDASDRASPRSTSSAAPFP